MKTRRFVESRRVVRAYKTGMNKTCMKNFVGNLQELELALVLVPRWNCVGE